MTQILGQPYGYQVEATGRALATSACSATSLSATAFRQPETMCSATDCTRRAAGGGPFHARTHALSVPLPHPCKTCEAIIRAACRERCAESTEWVHQWREHAATAKLAVRTLARTSSTVDALSCFGEASAFVLRAPPGVWMTILTKAPIVPMRYNVRGSALDRWPHLSGADRSAGFVLAAAFPLRAIHLTVTCM